MIKISDNSGENKIFIPHNDLRTEPVAAILVIKSDITKEEKEYSVSLTNEGNFFTFSVDLSNLEDGEYTYYLKYGDNIMANGLISIGNLKHEAVKNNKKTKYKQYNG